VAASEAALLDTELGIEGIGERWRQDSEKVYFFFSSRRRHTRWPRDWSSDVCSSDLPAPVRQSHDLVEIVRHEVDDSRLGGLVGEIGRASCRERVRIWGGGGALWSIAATREGGRPLAGSPDWVCRRGGK